MDQRQNGNAPAPQDLCPVQRPCGVIVQQQQVQQLNSRTMQLEQGIIANIQAVNAAFPHEWRFVESPGTASPGTLTWYCVWCCEWRAQIDVPTRRAMAAVD